MGRRRENKVARKHPKRRLVFSFFLFITNATFENAGSERPKMRGHFSAGSRGCSRTRVNLLGEREEGKEGKEGNPAASFVYPPSNKLSMITQIDECSVVPQLLVLDVVLRS